MEFSRTRGEPRTPPDTPPSSSRASQTPPYRPKPSVSPMDSPTVVHNSNVASLLSSEKGRSSPEPNCSICLGKLENKSFTNGCMHTFCFTCLLQWSKIKAECPLCKQAFKSIIHNVRSMQEYDEYQVTAPEPCRPPNEFHQIPYHDFLSTIHLQALSNRHHPITIPFRYSTTTTRRIDARFYTRVENAWVLPTQRSRSWRQGRQIATNDFRTSIYTRDLWAIPPEDLMGRVRDCSPGFYSANPAQVHRLVPWLNRELGVLLSNNTASIVLDLIMRMITQHAISSYEFRQLLRPHLTNRVDHFIHEFQAFASSHFDLISYDQAVAYGRNPAPPTYSPIDLVGDDSSSSDSDVLIMTPDLSVAGPSGMNNRRPTQVQANVASSAAPADNPEDSDDCLIVNYVKPRHERTPEIIDLSSEDEQIAAPENVPTVPFFDIPCLDDIDFDNVDLPDATLLFGGLETTSSSTSTANSTSSEFLPSKSSRKRKAPKKDVDKSKKESSKRSAPKKGKSSCKKCTKHKSRSVSCEKGKGKHRKSAKRSAPAATSTELEAASRGRRARVSRSNSGVTNDRARWEDSSADIDSETDATSLRNRLRDVTTRSRFKRVIFSSSDDEPIASTSTLPGPSRRQTRQSSSDVTHAKNTRLISSSDEDKPISRYQSRKKCKSHPTVGTSRKRPRHSKEPEVSHDNDIVLATNALQKQYTADSRKRQPESFAGTPYSNVIVIGSSAAGERVQGSNPNNTAGNSRSGSSAQPPSWSRYGAKPTAGGDLPRSDTLQTWPTRLCLSNAPKIWQQTLPPIYSSSSEDDDPVMVSPDHNGTVTLNDDSRSRRSSYEEQRQSPPLQWVSFSSPEYSRFDLSLENDRAKLIDRYVNTSSSQNLQYGTDGFCRPVPCTSAPYKDRYKNTSSSQNLQYGTDGFCRPIPSTSTSPQELQVTLGNSPPAESEATRNDSAAGEYSWFNNNQPSSRSAMENARDDSAPEESSEMWTILNPQGSPEHSDDSTSDSVDLEENQPRVRSIVIARSNNQQTSLDRSQTPSRSSSHSSSSNQVKNSPPRYKKKRTRRLSAESSDKGQRYDKWNRKRYSDSDRSTS